MKTWIPYPLKHGNTIHENTEDNITSINNKKEKEGDVLKQGLKEIVNFYQNNIALITPFVADEINQFLENKIDAELIIEVMKEAVSRNKRNWKYIAVILNSCIDNNIKTAEQFRLSQKEFKSSKNNKKSEKKVETREYEYLELSDDEYLKKLKGRKECMMKK